jgi:hypothetical protein
MVRKTKNKETKKIPFDANGQVKEDEVRALAYQLFCETGYQHGMDQEHWLEAEQRLLGFAKE